MTVTHVDGVVYARSVFHHSMNYRSAVVHGRARLVTDAAERLAGLRAVTEHVAPGSWDHARPPTRKELAATAVLALDLAEASVKVRTGPPVDDDDDVDAGGRWAGVVPRPHRRRRPAALPRCCPRAPRPRRTSCPADGTPCRLAGELPSSHVTTAPAYPRAERLDLVDHLHGRAVADPYRWLEDPDDPRTREWSTAQDALARAHLDALPGRDRLAATLRALAEAGWVGAPVWRAGRRFATRREPGQEHGVLHVTEPDGARRVLLDPVALDPTGLTTLDAWIPDHEGRLLAYQLSAGGDEHSVLHVLDVTTGDDVEQPDRPLPLLRRRVAAGRRGVLLRPHGRPGRGAAGRAGVPPPHLAPPRRRPTDTDARGPGLYRRRPRRCVRQHNYYGVDVSDDGRWLIVTGERRHRPPRQRLDRRPARPLGWVALIPVLTQADDVRCSAWVERDGRLYLLTTDGAPRFRLAVTDPATPGREHWRELVAEDPDSVLEGVGWLQPAGSADPADGLLALVRSRHAAAEVTLHDPDGTPRAAVPLPGLGALAGLTSADPASPEQQGRLWIGWTDLVTPQQVRRFDLATGETVLDEAAPGAVAVPPVRTEQRDVHLGRRHHRPDVRRQPRRRPGATPAPCSPATAASASIPSPPTAPPRWPGSGRAASTRWPRCAAAARRARRGTARATATTSRTCSTTSTPPRRPWSTPGHDHAGPAGDPRRLQRRACSSARP